MARQPQPRACRCAVGEWSGEAACAAARLSAEVWLESRRGWRVAWDAGWGRGGTSGRGRSGGTPSRAARRRGGSGRGRSGWRSTHLFFLRAAQPPQALGGSESNAIPSQSHSPLPPTHVDSTWTAGPLAHLPPNFSPHRWHATNRTAMEGEQRQLQPDAKAEGGVAIQPRRGVGGACWALGAALGRGGRVGRPGTRRTPPPHPPPTSASHPLSRATVQFHHGHPPRQSADGGGGVAPDAAAACR